MIDYELKFVKMQLLVYRCHYDNNEQKNFQIDLIRISRDLDLLLKIRHQELKVWCLANNLREKENSVCLNSNNTQIYFKPYIFSSRDKMFNKRVVNNSN